MDFTLWEDNFLLQEVALAAGGRDGFRVFCMGFLEVRLTISEWVKQSVAAVRTSSFLIDFSNVIIKE